MITTRILTVISLSLLSAICPQSSGAITGRVVSDSGIALAGINVFLYPVGDSRSGSPRRTTTDEEGNFSFSGLTGKSYAINVQSTKGYFQQPITEAGRRGPYSPGENVNLTMIKGGVITGRVLSPEGDPVVAVSVNAIMVRDRNGREIRASFNSGRPRFTDDLGVYRIYGLVPGSYIVAANSIQNNSPTFLYRGETTVFHPSSTRETANEIAVDGGSEVTGIDIRYRGEIGYRISGNITGMVDSDSRYGTSIALYSPAGMSIVATTGVAPGNSGFEFSGLSDGEYIVTARRTVPDEGGLTASPQRVAIKGSDVTGINLRLSPLATVAGKILLEKSPEAENKCAASIERAAVVIRLDGTDKNEIGNPWQPFGSGATISDTGLFTVRNLIPGRNRIEVRAHQNLYVRSITLPTPRVSRRAAGSLDLSRSGLLLNSGDKLSNLTITLVEGAALLVGKIIADEGSSLPLQLRVFLVPAEVTAADDLLRYFEVQTNLEQRYSIRNIPPGKYWLLSRPMEQGPINIPINPVAWDNNERAKLRREAEAKKIEIDLKPCQQLLDQILKY